MLLKDEECDSKILPIEIEEKVNKETDDDNNMFESKSYRNRRLRSSNYLISCSKMKINFSQSTSLLMSSSAEIK